MVGGAVLEIDGPIVGGRYAIVYQAVNCLYKKRIYEKADELEGGYCRSHGVCDGADVGGTQCTRLDKDEEAADGEQGGGDDVPRGAVVDKVDDAVELGTRA